ncbi:hypothetical protein BMW23_0592 [Bodo saltans virus]|uniref:Uncharacterized protein n=1 Tax=Bodo saltans virus TaxID=2024608 RepID=A0A2H4UUP9_9VIRU|nr:hypothetical protein QJ851_gp0575 [Bodo saltans virus]ATZ80638.1 hypothetical protein BMW23_0592 [Bodo saltans virus]
MNFIRVGFAIIIVIIALYLIKVGYTNKSFDYKLLYNRCVASVYDRVIESIDDIDNKYQKDTYIHKKKFRIKIYYKYEIDGCMYTSHFYNDGKNNDYIEQYDFLKISKMYDYVKYLTVFYKIDNPKKSYASLDKISKFYVDIYYIIAIILFLTLPFVMFI